MPRDSSRGIGAGEAARKPADTREDFQRRRHAEKFDNSPIVKQSPFARKAHEIPAIPKHERAHLRVGPSAAAPTRRPVPGEGCRRAARSRPGRSKHPDRLVSKSNSTQCLPNSGRGRRRRLHGRRGPVRTGFGRRFEKEGRDRCPVRRRSRGRPWPVRGRTQSGCRSYSYPAASARSGRRAAGVQDDG
jgi:hypothetical protein